MPDENVSKAFVHGFAYDAFVSYAHLDELKAENAPEGWVTVLVKALQTYVGTTRANELEVVNEGASDEAKRRIKLYWDYYLKTGDIVDDGLQLAVESSCVLIVIMSDKFLRSDWCKKELKYYFNTPGRAKPEVFIVEVAPTIKETWPEELKSKDYKTASFYDTSVEVADLPDHPYPPVFAWPNAKKNTKDGDFDKSLCSLQKQLAEKLLERHLDAEPASGSTSDAKVAQKVMPTQSSIQSVFLAQSADSLSKEEHQLRKMLTELGVSVYPEKAVRSVSDLRHALESYLPRCDAFLQLIDDVPGWDPDMEDGKVAHQAEQAVSVLGIDQAFFWLKPGADYEAKILAVDKQPPEQQPLLRFISKNRERMTSGTIEGFFNSLPKNGSNPLRFQHNKLRIVMEYVDNDKNLAEQTRDIIYEEPALFNGAPDIVFRGIQCLMPPTDILPSQHNKEKMERIRRAHSIIYIVSHVDTNWFEKKIFELGDYLGSLLTNESETDVEGPFVAVVVYSPADDVYVKDPDIFEFDFREGVFKEPLRDYVLNVAKSFQS